VHRVQDQRDDNRKFQASTQLHAVQIAKYNNDAGDSNICMMKVLTACATAFTCFRHHSSSMLPDATAASQAGCHSTQLQLARLRA
jgi:hypothetical protein